MPDQNNDETIFGADDKLVFAEESLDESRWADQNAWKLLIVDDEAEVHNVTRMVLEDLVLEGRGLEFLNAFSGQQAKEVLEQHRDTAVILLDVVMETDNSGLELVRYIRDELKNTFVRIILRTGHPGQAPERKVTIEYDINDYKEKAELTSQKLLTTVIAALRSYRDLKTIERNRQGLEQIIDASADLFKFQALRQFASGVLRQLTALLGLGESSLYLRTSGFAATRDKGDFLIVAATGQFEGFIDRPVREVVSARVLKDFIRVCQEKRSLITEDRYLGYFQTRNHSENILYLQYHRPLSELDKKLITIFSTNVAVAFDNIYLNQEVVDTQKEVIFTLGGVVETRSKETANHVRRVAEYSLLLALKAGMSLEEATLLREASPMHDVGKIAIPDVILNKPGSLTPEEFGIIKTHARVGYEILKNSNRKIMRAAATVSLQHHERWDGLGYPDGLKGEEIHIFGRITALADVFDALGHKRVYKGAWKLDRILELLRQEKEKHFDPGLVEIFLNNLDDFLIIKEKYPEDQAQEGAVYQLRDLNEKN
ncbi:MAG: DUF3369 domain-containing protein [Thermodesulfobacteriota bacterium]